MFRELISAALLTVATAQAVHGASNWKIDLFNDDQMSTCTVSYSAPGVIQVHVFHTGDAPSTASSFALYPPACMNGAVWLGDIVNPALVAMGNTQHQSGIAVAYTACTTMPLHLGYVNFYVADTNVSCCEFAVSDPVHEVAGIDGVTCDPMTMEPAQGGRVVVNPDAGCSCAVTLAVETTTWGKVKALYR